MASEQEELHEGFKILTDRICGMMTELEDCLSKLREIRCKTIQELENLIVKAKEKEEANHHGRNTKIALISGSSAAIAGTTLAAVGFGLSFVTFGTSLILTAVGAGIGGAGGLTLAGTNATKYFLNKEIYTEVQAAVARDREATQELLTVYKGIQSRVKHVNKLGMAKALVEKIINSPRCNACKGLKYLGKDIIFESVSAADNLKGIGKGSAAVGRTMLAGIDAAGETSATVVRSLSTAGRVAHIGGFAASVVLLPLDIYTLVTQSKMLHRGTNDVEERIKELITKLKLPEGGEITKVIEQCLRESLGNVLDDIMKIS